MIRLEWDGMNKMMGRMSALPDRVHAALLRKVTVLALKMEARIKRKLSGEVLNVKTGDLRRSIHHEVENTPNAIYGIVYSTGGRDKNPPYAAIHEFGGTIQHPGGTPYFVSKRDGRAMFVSKSAAVSRYLPVTRPHLIKIPERSYMRSTLRDMRQEIIDGLRQAAREGVRK